MERYRLLLLVALAGLGCCTAAGSDSVGPPPRVIWQIGQPDNNNAVPC